MIYNVWIDDDCVWVDSENLRKNKKGLKWQLINYAIRELYGNYYWDLFDDYIIIKGTDPRVANGEDYSYQIIVKADS